MDLSKNEYIFQIINKQHDLLNDDTIWTINILNGNTNWTENEFINFTNVMKNTNFKEVIDDDYLEICNNDDILKISKITNIIKFCSNENYNDLLYEWNKVNHISSEEVKDLFDADLNFNICKYSPSTEPNNWNELRKKYKIYKKFLYIDEKNDITYVAKLTKENEDNDFYTLKQSGVVNSQQKYEFSIIIKNKDNAISGIVKIIQSLFLSDIILTKHQQKDILDQYLALIKKDIRINKYSKDIPLLTPKPVTLERANLIDPNEYGSVSILSGYTVTEKADGERILLFINKDGKCYFISSSYRVEDSGLIASKNAYNSLVDGEFISCYKRKDIHKKNIYATFDIYYMNGTKITDLPLIDDKKSRYNELKSLEKFIDNSKATTDFIVKTHYYSDNILKDNKNILESVKKYPYEIDGLIFTPAKLALYSYYPSKPVEITENMKWDRVFKWKPEEQNTIDFLIRIEKDVIINGIKHKELSLWVGYNSSQWEDINPEKGLRLRYDNMYAKQNRTETNKYIPKLFKPTVYYHNNVMYKKAFIF